MSVIVTSSPSFTGIPFNVSNPEVVTVLMVSAAKLCDSTGSSKPKSAPVNVYGLSSAIITLPEVPCGASFTGKISMEILCSSLSVILLSVISIVTRSVFSVVVAPV